MAAGLLLLLDGRLDRLDEQAELGVLKQELLAEQAQNIDILWLPLGVVLQRSLRLAALKSALDRIVSVADLHKVVPDIDLANIAHQSIRRVSQDELAFVYFTFALIAFAALLPRRGK